VDAWTIVSNRKKCKVEEEKVKDSGGRVKRRTEGEGKSSGRLFLPSHLLLLPL
jgi:hypothetical protein